MRIKNFYGDTMREAMDLVKRDLGPEALILSSRQVKARPSLGLKNTMVYEITAALDDNFNPGDDAVPLETSTAHHTARPAVDPSVRRPRVNSLNLSRALPEEAAGITPALRREINQLRRLIYSLHAPSVRKHTPNPDGASHAVFCELLANEVDEALACQLIDRAKAELEGPGRSDRGHWAHAVRRLVSDMISVTPPEGAPSISGDPDRIVAAFVGPTGVGKTTTIAKLAARHALEFGRKALLVTLDTYRIAAIEQLRTYAGIIGVPVEVTPDVAGLDRVLSQNVKKNVVLIDTSGCSPREASRMSALAGYLDSHPHIEKHLVLSATTKPIDLQEVIDRFSIFGPTRLLFTKLDETSTFGPILNELVRTRKPLSYFTDGQKVPEDLRIPTAGDVADLVISSAAP